MGTFAGDAIGMPWRKSRAAPQKYTLGIRFWRKNRGIPRKQPRTGTSAKVSRSAQQENTRPRHSALRRPSPIPVTSVGRLGFCARIFPLTLRSTGRLKPCTQLSQPARVDGKALELDSPTLKHPTTRRPTAWLSRACQRMCGYDSFGPFVPFDSAARSLRGRVSRVDPTR